MKKSKHEIWKKEEYNYCRAGAFIPNIVALLHEDEEIRPAIIIAPGGAFAILQPSEAEYPARQFYDKGYNTFILTYTNNVTLDAPVKQQPLEDISRAVKYIRKNKELFHIDPNRVIACGFSAGGYVAGSLAVHHKKPELHKDDGYKDISNRLDATDLSEGIIQANQ